MTIMYLTFGQDTKYHVQAYLSMLSFRYQMTESDRLIVLTTAPHYYRHAAEWVHVMPITDSQVEEWQGPYHFFWRAKIKAIELVGQTYADGLLYVDCDTMLYNSISHLRQHLAEGHGLMDCDEGHPCQMKAKTLRMWKTVAGRTYGGITLGYQHHMYCAGVVGIPLGRRMEVMEKALALCDGMLADGAERVVIEQYSLSVALAETTGIVETKNDIAHYWSNKEEWMEHAMTFMADVLLSASSLEEQLKRFSMTDWATIPVYVYKSNTAERLHRLINRLFPDRNHRYLSQKSVT